MTPKVPTSDNGTAMLGMAVARALRRKMKTTAVTSRTLRINVLSTSWTEARMVVVRSTATWRSMAGEIDSLRKGRAFLTPSMVERMFAPGWRRMIMRTQRWPSTQPANRLFSTSSNTLATSPSRRVAPPWVDTIS